MNTVHKIRLMADFIARAFMQSFIVNVYKKVQINTSAIPAFFHSDVIHKAKHLFQSFNLNFTTSKIKSSKEISSMSKSINGLLIICIMVFAINTTFANNISVSTPTITGRNVSAGNNNVANFTLVQFNLSWDNSWRTSSAPLNWDAAWVFVKFMLGSSDVTNTGSSLVTTISLISTAGLRVGMPIAKTSGIGTLAANTVITAITSTTTITVNTAPTVALSGAGLTFTRIWEPATLSITSGEHTAPSGSTITPSSDGKGTFIYRSSNGSGSNAFNSVKLRWNYGVDGILDNSIVQVKVFGIEMVYVPQGSFYLGSGGTELGSFTSGSWVSGATIPYQITSENALNMGNTAGCLWSTTGTNVIAGTFNAAFPKGYNAFYCMKYEITQQQYVDFLNTLTRLQQTTRVNTNIAAGTTTVTNRYVMCNQATTALYGRNGIRCDATIHTSNAIIFYCDLSGNGTGGEANDGQWIACNWLKWDDGAAYTDWAGIRPMTEMEYEKACRGTASPVADEYAWGTKNIGTDTLGLTINNGGAFNEDIATNYRTNEGNANIRNSASSLYPFRVGIFAGNVLNTGRVTSGATYYGIMEMTGNVWEFMVTAANAAGRSFTGVHGDGRLNSRGDATVDYWPGINGNGSVITPNTVYGGTLGVIRPEGSMFRGGSWYDAEIVCGCISYRTDAINTLMDRSSLQGFRGVRLAP